MKSENRASKPFCLMCQYQVSNDKLIAVRTAKGTMQPMKRYCEHPKVKHKMISRRAEGDYGYPVWCPLAEAALCKVCGCFIRAEEGNYCKKHRR